MKKVGLMTWYTYKNYGTVLQAYALSEIIKKNGYECDLIDYKPKNGYINKQTYGVFFRRGYKKVIEIYNRPYIKNERNFYFDSFINEYFSKSNKCNTHSELKMLNEDYDAFVCGSDQIWSPLEYNQDYFLSFADEKKRIAYAPSFGVSMVCDKTIRKGIKNEIEKFSFLSTREVTGKKIIMELSNIETKVVLDPTLLMRSNEWENLICSVEKKIEGKYILCYFLGDSSKYAYHVRRLSKETGIPVFIIPIKAKKKKFYVDVPFEVGPKEFVSLIKNATYVCTDSFHGVIFSINFNISFFAYKRFSDKDKGSQNSRVIDILTALDLKDRLVDLHSKDMLSVEFDYAVANQKLLFLRQESIKYLSHSLKVVTETTLEQNQFNYCITDRCCGCGACAKVCPMNVISINQNDDGFYEYSIDKEKCIKCKKCVNICPFTMVDARWINKPMTLYAMKTKDLDILENSSSGGIATEVAKDIIAKKQWVSGAVYLKNQDSVKHIVIKELDDVKKIQASKYLQSYSYDAFCEVIQCVSKGEDGVFIGTPCQVAGLDRLLRLENKRDNVILIDLICHGVPSYHLWKKYLKTIDVGEHPDVLFRAPNKNKTRIMKIIGDKIYTNNELKDDFYAIFRRGICDMEACYDCPYRERTSADLRLGDYWGKKYDSEKQGINMVIIATENGGVIVNNLKKKCVMEEHPIDEYYKVQHPYNLKSPLYRKDLIKKLKNKNSNLHILRKEYCKVFDLIEFIQKMIR